MARIRVVAGGTRTWESFTTGKPPHTIEAVSHVAISGIYFYGRGDIDSAPRRIHAVGHVKSPAINFRRSR